MHIKDANFKKVQKNWEKPELQKRKSNLFHEKLELIKMSRHTHRHTHSSTAHRIRRGKQRPRPPTWLVSYRKTRTHRHTRSHTHALRQKQKTKPRISNRTLNLQQTQIQNYFTMLPFLIQKMPILGVYIYIYFFFLSGLLLTYFKYISVTTCNCLPELAASPSAHLPVPAPPARSLRSAGGRRLVSVKLNAMVLNTGQKTSDCHFNTWK